MIMQAAARWRVAAPRSLLAARRLEASWAVRQRPASGGAGHAVLTARGEAWRVDEATHGGGFDPVAPFLPAGYPATTRAGYGSYAALQFAAYTCSSACGVLSTRVLLTAVGVGDGAAAPLAAAANWAIKDGLGMLGGVAFAAGWAKSLDARPRQWRLRSSVALDAASLVELAALPAFPGYFVPIAGLANVAKNVSYLAASASRAAIHQSLSSRADASNLADLTAKAGSQTIAASLCGLALGVCASNAVGGDAVAIWPAWAALSGAHLTATYLSQSPGVRDLLRRDP